MIEMASVASLRDEVRKLRAARGRIGFVPTMGNLHEGHLGLVAEARRHADAVVASIYVNPLQFGPTEDYATYPRTPDADRAALARAGTELLFMPGDDVMYPRGAQAMTKVEVPGVSDILCGAFRPGHFRGVATVVNRLFNLVQPDVAVFGKKDYQQLLVIRLMVADLGLPIEIVGAETVREADGLALSSRNRYLNADERAVAPRLHAALARLRERVASGEAPAAAEEQASAELQQAGFRVDYVSVRRAHDLGPPAAGDAGLIALGAAWLGRTRLIDNVEISSSI
jgi:pantoate--beta-alanine ligase